MNNFLSKRLTVLMFFMVMPTGLCLAAANAAHEKVKTTINVGIYAPFSKHTAFIGRNMLAAVELARNQLKSSTFDYEFYTLDKMANNAEATRILQKFIEVHHINVLLTESTESGALVAPLAKKTNIIHFCISNDSLIADGKNNFLAQSPTLQHAKVLIKTLKPEFIAQFKAEYFSHPVTEAGYAYDILHLIHHSLVHSMTSDTHFSSQKIATNLVTMGHGAGVMGAFDLDRTGLLYKKQVVTG